MFEQYSPKIALIGAGNLGTCVLEGLLDQSFPADKLLATTASSKSAQALQEKLGINTTTDNLQAAEWADVVIIAVKPNLIATVLDDMQPVLQMGQRLVISLAAGVSSQFIMNKLGDDVSIVCAMPNIAACIAQSATAAYATPATTDTHRQLAHALLSSLGMVIWLEDETQLDGVVGLAASAPAYFFLVMEALVQAGEQMGVESQVAEQLVTQVCKGAGLLAQRPGESAQDLREQVTSSGGTTAKALDHLLNNDLAAIMNGAAQKAAQHAVDTRHSEG